MSERKIGVFAGSFDPVTLGHLDLIRRGIRLVDELYVVVQVNPGKKSLFSEQERVTMLQTVVRDMPGVRVMSYHGFTAALTRELGATVLLRGLRSCTDFDYENPIAQANRCLCPEAETVFLMTDPRYSFVSSSAVREIASYGGPLEAYLPEELISVVQERYARETAR